MFLTQLTCFYLFECDTRETWTWVRVPENRRLHSPILGWFSTCVSESLGSSFKGHMPRPFMIHWITEWGWGPSTPPHRDPSRCSDQEKEGVPFSHPLDVGQGPRQASLPLSMQMEGDRSTALLYPSTHTWPVPPGAQSVAVMNPASERQG